MINFQDAVALAKHELARLTPLDGDVFVLHLEQTIERPFGWVLFWGSDLYAKTGDLQYALAGNSPFIVNRHNATILSTGTALPVAEYIKQYEANFA
jgi:hypothetical protein